MGVDFKDYSGEVKAKLEEAIIAGLYEAAGEIEAQVKKNMKTSTATGQTKNAWQYRVDERKQEAHIGNTLENALWEEFGTGEWALEGNGRKSPWYVPVEKVHGDRKPTYKGKVVLVRGKDGQCFYKTDGKKPKRHFWKAYLAKADTAKRLIENAIERKMK